MLLAKNLRHKVITPIEDDPFFKKMLEAFPLNARFNQHDACALLGYEYTSTNAVYISILMREMSNILAHCPEGVQLKPSYGCKFYFVEKESA